MGTYAIWQVLSDVVLDRQAGTQGSVKQRSYLDVRQTVEDVEALLAVHNDARLSQDTQLLRDIGLWLAQHCFKMTDALRVSPQNVQNLQADRMSQAA